jgi:iron complex outermembrane receptor protein
MIFIIFVVNHMQFSTYLYIIVCSFLLLCTSDATAQETDTVKKATLPEVVVSAYGQERSVKDVPASISTIGYRELRRYNSTSIVAAVNTLPGIRMEERSPGSYRLSIRGSSLRSPFGVRNVKMYYNDIPITDPTGFTYLNQFGFYNLQQLQILKGPASSLYGAGNGGVLLANSMPEEWHAGASAGYMTGSYGMQQVLGEVRLGDSNTKNVIRYQHSNANGYRQQSASRKDVFSWDAKLKTSERNELMANFLYTDLYYQTPGGLTLAEYEKDARSARPTVGTTPGAIAQQAAIYQKNMLAGFTNKYKFSNHWQNKTTLYGAYAQVNNPNIRNYSRSNEPHYGGRTAFEYKSEVGKSIINVQIGAEAQQGFVLTKTYQNKRGVTDTLQSDDEINTSQYLGFAQLNWRIGKWIAEGGLSIGKSSVNLIRFSNLPATGLATDFGVQVSPRLALLYKMTNNTSVYAQVSRGFSPPTGGELSPSGSAINITLAPEVGLNYEAGVKGYAQNNRLYYDVSLFYYTLTNTIVQRKDSLGGDYYTNAGSTEQSGIEARVDYVALRNTKALDELRLWAGYTGYHFRYQSFKQVEADYSGNDMPGVAPHTLSAGVDAVIPFGIAAHITYLYTAKIWLNDANTARADAYNLLCAKLSWTKTIKAYSFEIYAGADNLLNQQYSLGNDINAAGGRYYNAAAGTNYYAGILLHYNR